MRDHCTLVAEAAIPSHVGVSPASCPVEAKRLSAGWAGLWPRGSRLIIEPSEAEQQTNADRKGQATIKTSLDQFCINVTDLEKSVHFYETLLDFEVTHRVEIPNLTEVDLAGEDGNRIQLAWHHDHEGPIEHGSALWKFYLSTDDCEGLYQRCMDAGIESISPPERLDDWPVTAAFVSDPGGYQVEILQHHAPTPQGLSGPAANKSSDGN